MSSDDDTDCVEHVWDLDLTEVKFTLQGAATVSRCSRCRAVSYEPEAGLNASRPPL